MCRLLESRLPTKQLLPMGTRLVAPALAVRLFANGACQLCKVTLQRRQLSNYLCKQSLVKVMAINALPEYQQPELQQPRSMLSLRLGRSSQRTVHAVSPRCVLQRVQLGRRWLWHPGRKGAADHARGTSDISMQVMKQWE